MDLPHRALATADWLKERTISLGSPLREAPRAVATRAFERGDAIVAAALAKGEQISSISLNGQVPRPDLLGKAFTAGIGLLGRGQAAFGLGLSRNDLSCRDISNDYADLNTEDEDDEGGKLFVPRPLRMQARQILTVHLSRFASLRVAVACSLDACEAFTQRLRDPQARPILAKVCIAAVQNQISRRAEHVARLAPLAVSAVQKVFGDRLTEQASDLFQRLAERIVGDASHIQDTRRVESTGSGPLIEEVLEGEAAECIVLHGECGPAIHVPLQCEGAPASGYLQPLGFNLISRNGFIEFDEEPESLTVRSRSYSDSGVYPPTSYQPFSLEFNCANGESLEELLLDQPDSIMEARPPEENHQTSTCVHLPELLSHEVIAAVPELPVSLCNADHPTDQAKPTSSEEDATFTSCRSFTSFDTDPWSEIPLHMLHSSLLGGYPNIWQPLVQPPPMLGCQDVWQPLPEAPAAWPEQHVELSVPPGFFFPETIHSTESEITEYLAVQLRNLPADMTRDVLLKLLDKQGFKGRYRFVYLPMNFTHGGCLGYADVLMDSTAKATDLLNHFRGFQLKGSGSLAAIEASWCEQDRQSLSELIRRYRDSPVMHKSVPELHRPALFENGVRVKFPPPTQTLRRPRIRNKKD
jgi:hypothetical protein